jgi:hypothetical protein
MRLRLPELIEAAELTPYALAKRSGGRISLSTAYRLCRMRGSLESFEARALDALCDVLGVEPGDLFERQQEDGAASTPAPKSKPRRAR